MKNFRLFKKDEAGVMTVEFAILLPVIFMWFAGLFLFFQAFHGWMKSLKASYTVSDILSRQTKIDDDYITSLNNLFTRISHSRDSSETWLRVVTVNTDDQGDLEIEWQYSTKNPTKDPAFDIDEDDLAGKIPIMAENDSLVFIETHRPYNPVFTNLGLESMDFVSQIASPLRFKNSLENEDHFVAPIISDDGIDDEGPEEGSS